MEPEHLHASSDTLSTSDLALILEKKYGLVTHFEKYIEKSLHRRLDEVMSRFLQQKKPNMKNLELFLNQRLGGWLQNEWREYINQGNYGIITEASKHRGSQPFVNTGDYFKSMIVRIKLQ